MSTDAHPLSSHRDVDVSTADTPACTVDRLGMAQPVALDSTELFGAAPHDRPEIHIRHGDQTYRLRRTAAGKLILTK